MEMAIFITACAALIAGIANIVMIFEVKEQKRAVSSPALKLIDKNCEAVYKDNYWEWGGNKSHGIPIELINFGAGPAFNVSINWFVEMKELLETIKQFDQKMEGMLQIGNTFHNTKLQNNKKFHAIPAYDKQDINRLLIPWYYVSAFEKFIEIEVFNSENEITFELSAFPRLLADISYEDINKNLEKKRFEVIFDINAITSGDHRNINMVIKIKEL
jgi:hypothetical protein